MELMPWDCLMGLCYFFMFGSELRIYAQNFCHLHTGIVVVLMFSSLFSFLFAFPGGYWVNETNSTGGHKLIP